MRKRALLHIGEAPFSRDSHLNGLQRHSRANSFKYMFELGKQTMRGLFERFDVRHIAEVLESLAFFVGQLLGDVDHDVDQLVAYRSAVVGRGETLATQAKHFTGLRAGGNIQSGTSCDGRHLYGASESGGRNIQHHIIDYV